MSNILTTQLSRVTAIKTNPPQHLVPSSTERDTKEMTMTCGHAYKSLNRVIPHLCMFLPSTTLL